MKSLNRLIVFFLIFVINPCRVLGEEEIDRIVAVVGNEVILLSELRESVILAARQLQMSFEDTTRIGELQSELLNGMIEEKVILQRAKVEGIEVSDEELNAEVERDLEKVISRFASREEFEVALASQGLDMYSYREQLRKEKEKQLIQQRFMQVSKMPYVRVSDEEARKFFDENFKDKTMKPATVQLREIVLKIKLSDTNLIDARELTMEAQQRIAEGEAFESVARQMSQDRSTKDLGGDLGSIAESDVLPVIFEAIGNLLPGEVSNPVETAQGIHLFKVSERKGGMVHLSHILFKAKGAGDPFEETMTLAKELVIRVESGEDFGAISENFSTDENVRDKKGSRGEELIENLPSSYGTIIEEMEEGDISDPFVVEDQVVIVKLEKKMESRPYRYEEVKDQLIENLGQERAYQQFVKDLEKKTYINNRL
jgi:peptidyl-prolyl cis-trans isomerase SurA